MFTSTKYPPPPQMRSSSMLSLFVMTTLEISVSRMAEAQRYRNAVVPISVYDVSIRALSERYSCWRRHRESFSSVTGGYPSQSRCLLYSLAGIPTFISRPFSPACSFRRPAAHLVLRTNQNPEEGMLYSSPNCSILLFQIIEARVFGGTVP